MSPIPAGQYEATNEGVRYRPPTPRESAEAEDAIRRHRETGRRWTRPQIELALRAIEEVRRADPDTIKDAIDLAERINPDVARVIKGSTSAWTRDQKLVLISIILPTLVALLGILLEDRSNEGLTTEQVTEVVRIAVETSHALDGMEQPAEEPAGTSPFVSPDPARQAPAESGEGLP